MQSLNAIGGLVRVHVLCYVAQKVRVPPDVDGDVATIGVDLMPIQCWYKYDVAGL